MYIVFLNKYGGLEKMYWKVKKIKLYRCRRPLKQQKRSQANYSNLVRANARTQKVSVID